MKTRILARLQHMAQSEIMGMIPGDVISRIKVFDSNPEIRVYVVGHEGEAKPNMIGHGSMLFQYFKDAVRKLGNKIREGILAFDGHVPGTNAHSGRQPVGEIVGKAVKDVGGKLSALAAVYIYPEHRQKSFDIASIEADVEYSFDDRGIAQVDDFDNLSGLALGDSRKEKPAFPGATLLATMQAFQNDASKRGKLTHTEGAKMTLEELRQAVREGKFSPSDIYSEGELTSDSVVKRIANKAEQTGYEHHRQKLERQIGKPVDDYIKESDEKIKSLIQEKEDLVSKVALKSVGDVVKSIVTDRKYNDKQVAFIERAARSFKAQVKTEDELKVELQKFVDVQIKEFDETAKLLGVKVEGNDGKPNPDGKDRGVPAGDGKGGKDDSSSDPDDLTDPKNNEFIPSQD